MHVDTVIAVTIAILVAMIAIPVAMIAIPVACSTTGVLLTYLTFLIVAANEIVAVSMLVQVRHAT
jgi:hypothetical protein